MNFYVVAIFWEYAKKKLKLRHVLLVVAPVLQSKGLYSDA